MYQEIEIGKLSRQNRKCKEQIGATFILSHPTHFSVRFYITYDLALLWLFLSRRKIKDIRSGSYPEISN